MDDLESYEPQSAEVLDVEPGWVTVYLEERMPAFGEAVAVERDDGGTAYVAVHQRLGGRKARAQRLGDDGIEVGDPARATGRPAGFRLAEDGSADLRSTRFVPEPDDPAGWTSFEWTSPEFSEIRGAFSAVETGYEGLDAIAPVAEGGTNLVIDTSDGRSAADHLTRAVVDGLRPIDAVHAPVEPDSEEPDWVTHPIRCERHSPRHVAALRMAVALAADRRSRGDDLFVCVDLPTPGRTPASDERQVTEPGYGELIDLLGSGLASTRDAAITTLVRLPVPERESDLAPIIETLDLGDVDAQIVLDGSGRFAPDRSTSDADRSDDVRRRADAALETLRRAERARQKRDLLGERELSPDERDAIEQADALRTDLTTPPEGD